MIGTDRSSQAINPNVHKIENPTTNSGKKVPVQLLKLKIRSKIIKPNAIGVKVLISLFAQVHVHAFHHVLERLYGHAWELANGVHGGDRESLRKSFCDMLIKKRTRLGKQMRKHFLLGN